MKVCIAEKPSVAREIAIVLGANTKRDGHYEGNGYAVTYTFGHLCTLFEPNDYKSYWKRWDLNNLPMLPEKFNVKTVDNSGIKKQFNIVKDLFDKAEEIINCGDAGQEGELIQRWVMSLSNYKGKVKRLWISSLTTEAIKEGFENLKPASNYDNLYYAGFSRAIGDWLLGMNATRLYTLKHGGYKQVLSIGRVQTPTLAMIVERYKSIENFMPQPYWELQTLYRNTLFSYEEGRFLNKEDGEALANKVKESDFEIVSITKKKGKEYAPKLFDLTGLQVYCNTKFGFSADDTLKIAQKLYEQKVVTYPRVDTTFLPNDIYPKVTGILKNLTNYSILTQPLLGKKIKKSTKVFNDKKVTDHHAIIPTGIQINLQQNQQKVYDIIVKRFIAVFYNDCQVANTTVIGNAENVSFKTTGKEIVSKGWRVVFETSATLNDSNSDSTLPSFVKGEKGPHEPSFLEKQTKPPNQFTEASLLRAMETAGKQVDDDEMRDLMKENGIGRPSTRANIIETLFKRNYIKRNKKQILPTTTGIQLIDIIQNELLKSAELTGQWEKQLKQIEQGTYSANQFIKNMKQMVDDLVYEVRSETTKANISHENTTITKPSKKPNKPSGLIGKQCPKCKQGVLIKGATAYGCSAYKSGCRFVLPFTFKSKKISEKQYLRLLEKESTVNLKGFKVNEQKVEGLIRFNDAFELVLEQKIPKTINCPKCRIGTIIKGKTAYGCSNYNNGCGFKFLFSDVKKIADGQTITKKMVYEILTKNKS
ncbi:DNA topoisomerase 3 [Pontimicrobium sp. SW4]|uniref:DNA topoisomerase n=1 Tax=Pontimicrobium sp. SW4 TaxID=3153519 RepID=A0AAU7BX04_9FLAO